jgi:hypothetical protein
VKITALVDTGASATCLDHSVLQTLALTPTGSVPVITPSTGNLPVIADQYDISLLIPSASTNQVPLVIGTIPVVCCADLLLSQGFQALIGRDVLAHCVFIYNGSIDSFTIAY